MREAGHLLATQPRLQDDYLAELPEKLRGRQVHYSDNNL